MADMKSLLASDWEVRAFIAGSKTQKRIPARPQPENGYVRHGCHCDDCGNWYPRGRKKCPTCGCEMFKTHYDPLTPRFAPFRVGDRVYVKETYLLDERNSKGRVPQEVVYDASPEWAMDHTGSVVRVRYITGEIVPPDEARRSIETNRFWHKCPSTTMPRWAARIFLEVVGNRAERLQDITEQDARAEGVEPDSDHPTDGSELYCYRAGFHRYWDATYARRGLGWSVNPFVFVPEFRRVQC